MLARMKYLLVSLCLIVCVSESARAQASQDVSELLRTQVRTSASLGDYEAARRANQAALALQPGHYGFLSNAVVLADRAGNSDDVLAALEALAARGLVFDLDRLQNRAALEAQAPDRLAAVTAQLNANAVPVGDAREIARPVLAQSLITALAVDSETERMYIGATAEPFIYRVEPFTPEAHEVFAGHDFEIGAIHDLAIDRSSARLYATEAFDDQPTALLALDLETGELIARYQIEGAGRMHGVTVRDGMVFVTDPEAGRIYRLASPRAELEVFAEDTRFADLRGVIATRGALYVADQVLGLWRVDPVTRQATLLPSPDTASLIGLVGLDVDRTGRVFSVRTSSAPTGIFEIEFDEGGVPSTVSTVLSGDMRLGELSTVRVSDGRAFLIADTQAETRALILAVPY